MLTPLSHGHLFQISNVRQISDINGRMSFILNLIKLDLLTAYPSLKPHILFYSNGLASYLAQFYRYYVY